MFNTDLDIKFYSKLLYSFYNIDTSKLVENTKDIYVSRSWRDNELALAQKVSNFFIEKDFWLIGDLEDNTSYSDARVASIMKSCGGLLSIVPNRGNDKIPKYHKKELDIAASLNLPILIVSDFDIVIPNEINAYHVKIENMDKFQTENLFLDGFYNFSDDWKKPSAEQFIFFATNLNDEFTDRNETVRKLSEIVTARECVMGEEIRTGHIQQNIVNNIKKSFLVLADISENRLNTCIEVGIARGANKNVKLVSKGPRESPPFMFRDLQVHHYEKDEELLVYVHKLLLPYRRRVLNLE